MNAATLPVGPGRRRNPLPDQPGDRCHPAGPAGRKDSFGRSHGSVSPSDNGGDVNL
jgi:hypothetical protein